MCFPTDSLTPRAPCVSQESMQRTPKVGETVYAWENDVAAFDLADWQEQVFQPIKAALLDSGSAYGKREVTGKKNCIVKAPDGSTWWVLKAVGKSGVCAHPRHLPCCALNCPSHFTGNSLRRHLAAALLQPSWRLLLHEQPRSANVH